MTKNLIYFNNLKISINIEINNINDILYIINIFQQNDNNSSLGFFLFFKSKVFTFNFINIFYFFLYNNFIIMQKFFNKFYYYYGNNNNGNSINCNNLSNNKLKINSNNSGFNNIYGSNSNNSGFNNIYGSNFNNNNYKLKINHNYNHNFNIIFNQIRFCSSIIFEINNINQIKKKKIKTFVYFPNGLVISKYRTLFVKKSSNSKFKIINDKKKYKIIKKKIKTFVYFPNNITIIKFKIVLFKISITNINNYNKNDIFDYEQYCNNFNNDNFFITHNIDDYINSYFFPKTFYYSFKHDFLFKFFDSKFYKPKISFQNYFKNADKNIFFYWWFIIYIKSLYIYRYDCFTFIEIFYILKKIQKYAFQVFKLYYPNFSFYKLPITLISSFDIPNNINNNINKNINSCIIIDNNFDDDINYCFFNLKFEYIFDDNNGGNNNNPNGNNNNPNGNNNNPNGNNNNPNNNPNGNNNSNNSPNGNNNNFNGNNNSYSDNNNNINYNNNFYNINSFNNNNINNNNNNNFLEKKNFNFNNKINKIKKIFFNNIFFNLKKNNLSKIKDKLLLMKFNFLLKKKKIYI